MTLISLAASTNVNNLLEKKHRPRVILWCCFFVIECLCIRHYRYHLTNAYNADQDETNQEIKSILHLNQQILKHEQEQNSIEEELSKENDTNLHQLIDLQKRLHHPDSIDIYERSYPKTTHLLDYTTSATEAEIIKHDRLLVQGMVFMSRGLQQTSKLFQKSPQQEENYSPKVCINIYLCNRRVPYINSLLMTLMSTTTDTARNIFLEQAQVHLLNTEKRKDRVHFPYLTDTLSKLPFVHEVHNITYRDEIYGYINDRELDFRELFISDEISGLKICVESNLPYCLMMEEDATVTVDFMQHLMEQVIEPMEKDGSMDNVSIISLYSYYNLVFFGDHRLAYPDYSKLRYQNERSKLNVERKVQGLPPYKPQFKVEESEYKYGTVAMLYTRQSAIRLIEYLQKVGVNPEHNADEFMNAPDHFPNITGAPRRQVEPSLVNHIGYYSERMADVKSRGMFSQLNTDVRFMYDPGDG